MARSSNRRKKIPPDTEAEVLTECRRRCCLCYHLDNITAANLQGQIAHIDRDRTNHKPINLAYLCFDHHDKYDSKTSQSKGLTEQEVANAKASLLAFLAADASTRNEYVSLTLTLSTSAAALTDAEREHLLRTMLPSLVKASHADVNSATQQARYTVTFTAEDALHICKRYSARTLPSEIIDVRVSRPDTRRIAFHDLWKTDKNGVSKQMAMEVVTGHDQSMLFSGKEIISFGAAGCGMFTKRFKSKSERYTILVIASIDEHLTVIVYAAIRLEHTIFGNLGGLNPLKCLEAFLATFGFDVRLPGKERVSLLLGETITLPPGVSDQDQVWQFMNRYIVPQVDHTAGVIGHISYTIPNVARIHLYFCFDRQRYLKSIR